MNEPQLLLVGRLNRRVFENNLKANRRNISYQQTRCFSDTAYQLGKAA